MGIYLNPTNESFIKATESQIYVDKTELLEILNHKIRTEESCISLSHARRFGKSQAARMIDAYYSSGCDSKELFSKYKISNFSDFEKHLNKYNVIHLDISSFADFYKDDIVEKIIQSLYSELKADFPDISDINVPINIILMQIYKISGKPFVIIIDEWDHIVRNISDRPDTIHKYLQFLHSIFKSEESARFLGLAYITGILPIKKIKDESAMNNFMEYSMINAEELTQYFGFTKKEVEELCVKYNMNIDSAEEWYNGYLINGIHMYNPNSVYQAMTRHRFDSYWKNTSAFDTINTYITLNYDGLKEDVMAMLAGNKISVNTETFKNDLSLINSKDDALTALIHLGYLGYDSERKKAYIPNYEVAAAFHSALAAGNWSEIAKTISQCDKLLWATIDNEPEKVAELIELAHETYTSILKYNDENSLSCVITMAYFTAPAYYTVIRELPSGKGFADIALIPRADSTNKPAMIIELKWDNSADTAIKQIKEKRYAGKLKEYSSELLLVGINYDKETKKHECVIENMKMN